MWFAAGREFPFAECSSQKLVLGCRCDGVSALSGHAGSGGMAAVWAKKDIARPILLAHEGEPIWSGFQAPESPSKASGPREPGAARPRFALWRAQGRGEKGLRCFPEPRRLRDVVCFGREFPFAECSSQKLVLGRRCDGASAMCGHAGSGGMAGVWAKKAFAGPILLAH